MSRKARPSAAIASGRSWINNRRSRGPTPRRPARAASGVGLQRVAIPRESDPPISARRAPCRADQARRPRRRARSRRQGRAPARHTERPNAIASTRRTAVDGSLGRASEGRFATSMVSEAAHRPVPVREQPTSPACSAPNGRPPAMVRVVHTGTGEAEFAPIVPRRTQPTSFVCELRPGQSLRRPHRGAVSAQVKAGASLATIAGRRAARPRALGRWRTFRRRRLGARRR